MAIGDYFTESPGVMPNFSANPSLAPTPTVPGGFDWTKMLTNPGMQATMFQLAGAIDPKGFGGRLAGGGLNMLRAMQMAEAVKNTIQNQPQPQNTPQPGGTPNPLDASKALSTASSTLKKAGEMDPSTLPGWYGEALMRAYKAPPPATMFQENTIGNPTQPVGSEFAGQPTGAMPPVQLPNTGITPSMAMAMDPDDVKWASQNAVNVANTALNIQKQINENMLAPIQRRNVEAITRHYDADSKLKAWEMSPEGQAFKLRYAGEPARAAARMAEVRHQMRRQELDQLIADGGLDKMPAPGGMFRSMGEMLRASQIDAQGVQSAAYAMNAALDYKASIAATAARYAEIKENRSMRQENVWYKQLQVDDQELIKYKGMRPESSYGKDPKSQAQLQNDRLMGKVMTGDDYRLYQEIQARRQDTMKKLGIKYTPLPTTFGAGTVTVTPEMMRASKEGSTALETRARDIGSQWMRYADPDYLRNHLGDDSKLREMLQNEAMILNNYRGNYLDPKSSWIYNMFFGDNPRLTPYQQNFMTGFRGNTGGL